jgi:Zn-dependent M28 family amino/carboxypeptidase
MKTSNIIAIIAFVLIVSNVSAQNIQRSDDEVFFRTQTEKIGSDAFGGRKPLTEYEDIAIHYIADQFKELGLKPGNGDSYFQDVPLLDVTTRIKGGAISVYTKKGKVLLKDQDDVVLWSPQTKKQLNLKNLEFVFAGFGIKAPEYGWDDYKGLDAKGKIVVVLVNDPGYYDTTLFRGHNMTYYGRWIYKFEEASRQGAAGVLVVHDTKPASYPWNVVQASWSKNKEELVSDKGNLDQVQFKGWITKGKAEALFASAGYTYDQLLQKALRKDFSNIPLHAKASVIVNNKLIIGNSHNVAALFPGTDLKEQYVIYSAHWDHLGIGKPVNGDSIYNGASDNASGVAALLTIAKRFTELKEKPRRSILFLSVTGEEAVLLGSQYYTEYPLVPLAKTAVDINFDGIAPRAATNDLLLGAEGDSETDGYVYIAAAAQGRKVLTSKENTSGGYFRSDHFSFAKAGIPVVLAGGGTDFKNSNAPKRNRSTYHQPSDEYSDAWDFSGSLDDLYLNFSIGLSIANADKLPQWYKGASYKRLY